MPRQHLSFRNAAFQFPSSAHSPARATATAPFALASGTQKPFICQPCVHSSCFSSLSHARFALMPVFPPGVLTPRHARSPSSSLLRSDREAKYAEWFHEMRKTTFSNSRYCYECDKPLPRIVRGGYQCKYAHLPFLACMPLSLIPRVPLSDFRPRRGYMVFPRNASR